MSLAGRPLNQDAVAQLLEYLRNPELGQWQKLAGIIGLAALLPSRPSVQSDLLQTIMQRLRTDATLPPLDVPADAASGDHRYGVVEHYGQPLHLMVIASEAALKAGSLSTGLSVTLRLEDDHDERSGAGFSKHWRQFWLLTNLLQFLPDYAAVSAEFIQQFVAEPAAPGAQPETPAPSTADPAWAEALKFADPVCATLLAACQETGVHAPVVGFELFDPSGAIVAQAELAWPDRRIAVFSAGPGREFDALCPGRLAGVPSSAA